MPAEGGLYIVDVAEGSDALAKGIKPGDILMEADGVIVSATADLAAMKDKLSVGDTMHFKILRDGKVLEFEIEMVDTNDIYG